MTKQELIDFEAAIAKEFEAGHIHAPVHLEGGNEDALIDIFRGISPDDYVFGTHRSHYKALLHGVSPELVKREILAGHSISLQFPEYHFFTSAIVGGIIPIALGVAMTGQKCWVFIGDMAAETGIFKECSKYADRVNLPIRFVIEKNGFSVDTPIWAPWAPRFITSDLVIWDGDDGHKMPHLVDKRIREYDYDRTYPHQGSGKWVTF